MENNLNIYLLLFSCVQLLVTAAQQAPRSSTTSQCLLKLMSTESKMLSIHLILCCPFLLSP